jgi:serine/threonine protein kinase
VLRAALERPSGERASFIAELCGGDQDLKRSVERLLDEANATSAEARRVVDDAPELPQGSMLAHYRIDQVVGRGGMGVVYRATDTKLSRPVAIKLLSAATASVEAQRRFRLEATTASGLNHPHIVTVYDVGEHEGRQYIVSELVDGGTLEDWAASTGRRGWRQDVELLTGVADALAAAHKAGVLHRDVKPGNILIASQGYAKLADFGLAKLVDADTRDGAARSLATRAGWVVGTVAYMSPEQAAAQPLDARSDVFSFGVVLYELLAGRRPFAASSDLAVLKAIAESTPASLPDAVPEPLRNVVERALEKDPTDRYQTMQDLVADLRRAARKAAVHPDAVSSAKRNQRVPLWLAAGVAAASLGVASWAFFGMPASDASPGPRLHLTLAAPGYEPGALAISPDGASVAYAAAVDGARRLWLQPLGTGAEPRPLPGTEGARGAFWSPNGESIGFLAERDLKRVDIAGGGVETLGEAYALVLAGAWLPDDTILYTVPTPGVGRAAPLGRIPAAGGPTALVAGDGVSGNYFYALPRALPGGQQLLFARMEASGALPPELYVGSIEGGGERRVAAPITLQNPIRSGQFGNFAYAHGFLLYYRNQTLVAQRFDSERLEALGSPLPLAEEVGEFSVSDDVLVWRGRAGPAAWAPRPRRLVWYDRSGTPTGRFEAPLAFNAPVLAPDERRVALSVRRPEVSSLSGIVVADERGGTTRLTLDAAHEGSAVWSPDGTRLAFTSGREAWVATPSRVYERAATGTGAERLLFAAPNDEIVVVWDWTRDGRILFGKASAVQPTFLDIWVLPLSDGELREPYPLIESQFWKMSARISPDGRWIAYNTNESGRHEVVIQGFPDIERGKWPVSTNGGVDPHWRGDGGELFFVGLDGAMMAATVSADGDALAVGAPQALFTLVDPVPASPDFLYSVTSDGQRFLVNELVSESDAAGAQSAPPVINVIVNWSAGLPR